MRFMLSGVLVVLLVVSSYMVSEPVSSTLLDTVSFKVSTPWVVVGLLSCSWCVEVCSFMGCDFMVYGQLYVVMCPVDHLCLLCGVMGFPSFWFILCFYFL
jgi:hypothetical protein